MQPLAAKQGGGGAMVKEAGIGVSLALIIFLLWQGVNILPLVFLLGLGYFLVYMIEGRGLGNNVGKIKNQRSDKTISFEEIGGQERAKNELLESLNFILQEREIKGLGIRPIKGILLSGPPGTGKTLLARAAAGYADSIFLAASGGEFVEMYAGVGAKRIRGLFKEAKERIKTSPTKSGIIFIDEIDVLGSKRGQVASHMEYDQTLNQLLVEMDGLDNEMEGKILVLAATNRIEALDDALLRPGRFDRIVRVDLPCRQGRLHILKIHTKGKPLAESVSLEKVARETFGFSGAHLESLANEAAILALREEKNEIEQGHFLEAIEKVMLGEKTETVPSRQEKKRISIHETGHAFLSEILFPGSVANITVSPRGGALGYVRQRPPADNYLQTQEDILKAISVKIAGTLAEEEFLGSKSTGAMQDLKEVHDLARLLVKAGMSSLGYVDWENLPQGLWHQAISEIVTNCQKNVRETLQGNKDIFQNIADELLREESMTGSQLRELMADSVEAVQI